MYYKSVPLSTWCIMEPVKTKVFLLSLVFLSHMMHLMNNLMELVFDVISLQKSPIQLSKWGFLTSLQDGWA